MAYISVVSDFRHILLVGELNSFTKRKCFYPQGTSLDAHEKCFYYKSS